MPRFYPIAIEVDGRRYAGDWTLMLGGRVCVRWALGSETAEIGRAKPEMAAARTLEHLVRTDQKRRAKGLAQQEREMAKVRRSVARRRGADAEPPG